MIEHLFDILKGVPAPTSPRTLVLQAETALDKVNLSLFNVQHSIMGLS